MLTLNNLQREKFLGRPCKRRIRRLYRRNTTAKATLHHIDKKEQEILMANNLSNAITSALEKNTL